MPPPEAHPGPFRTALAFSVCTLIWGSTFLFISIGNDTVPPFWAVTLRVAIAALVLSAAALLSGQGLPRGRALGHAVTYGVLQFGIGFPLLYWGEQRVPSGLAAVLFATIPLSSAVFARWLGIERLARARVIGALVSLAGVVIIFSGELSRAVPLAPLLAVVLSTLTAVLGSLVFKRGPRQPVLGANAAACAAATGVALLVSVAAGESRAWPAGFAAWFPVLYLALAGSIGAFVLWTWLISHGSVTRLSFIAVLTPLIALTLGAVVRHERLAPLSLLGGLVVLAGVAVGMEIGRRPAPH